MFEIEYKGANGIVITSKHTTLVVDPKISLAGLKDVAVKNAVELGTEERFLLRAEQSQLALEGPGEYEVGDFSIRGVAAQRHIDAPGSEPLATIYRVEVQGVHIAIIGNIVPKLSDEQLEQLGLYQLVAVATHWMQLALLAWCARWSQRWLSRYTTLMKPPATRCRRIRPKPLRRNSVPRLSQWRSTKSNPPSPCQRR